MRVYDHYTCSSRSVETSNKCMSHVWSSVLVCALFPPYSLACNCLDMSAESESPGGLVLPKFINNDFKVVEIE